DRGARAGAVEGTDVRDAIRAAVLHETDRVAVEDVEVDEPRGREVLIRTVAAGVCHTDIGFIRGSFPRSVPMVLGHESAGIVERVGEQVTHVEPGDHVVTCPWLYCGSCAFCLAGQPQLCMTRAPVMRGEDESPRVAYGGQPLGQMTGLGSFAERLLVHE